MPALRLLVRHPLEGYDRIRNTIERVAVQRAGGAASAADWYTAQQNWEQELHGLLGIAWPCPDGGEFDAMWPEVIGSLPEVDQSSCCHDAGKGLARASWCLTRHLKPERVVETGVARGVTTRFILEGLASNGDGHLWSIDLPPIRDQAAPVGVAVPQALRTRWTYLRGSSRRLLPGLLELLDDIEMFVHDSLHTARQVRFEIETVWRELSPRGVVLVDDVAHNTAFREFTDRQAERASSLTAAADDGVRPSFGILLKPQVVPDSARPM